MGLRVQPNVTHGALAGLLEQGLQERGAHPAPAPFAEYRHPADPAVGQQPRRSDRLSLAVASDCVIAAFVPFVQLELARNPLFFDEHLLSNRPRQRQRFVPCEDADRESCPHQRPV